MNRKSWSSIIDHTALAYFLTDILNLKEISFLEKVLYGKEREEDLILFHYRPGPGLPPDKSCQ
jgi:hypothetical protein